MCSIHHATSSIHMASDELEALLLRSEVDLLNTHPSLVQVLRRAIPEEEEKSMKTASGRTFTRSS